MRALQHVCLGLRQPRMRTVVSLKLPYLGQRRPGVPHWARPKRKVNHGKAPPGGSANLPGGNPLPKQSQGRGEYPLFLYGQPRFMASMSSLSLRACWARSATAFEASPMASAVCPDMLFTSTMDWLISSLAADCCSLAVAMALT